MAAAPFTTSEKVCGVPTATCYPSPMDPQTILFVLTVVVSVLVGFQWGRSGQGKK